MLPAFRRIRYRKAGLETGAPSVRFKVPMRDSDIVETFHEPAPGLWRAELLRRLRNAWARRWSRRSSTLQKVRLKVPVRDLNVGEAPPESALPGR